MVRGLPWESTGGRPAPPRPPRLADRCPLRRRLPPLLMRPCPPLRLGSLRASPLPPPLLPRVTPLSWRRRLLPRWMRRRRRGARATATAAATWDRAAASVATRHRALARWWRYGRASGARFVGFTDSNDQGLAPRRESALSCRILLVPTCRGPYHALRHHVIPVVLSGDPSRPLPSFLPAAQDLSRGVGRHLGPLPTLRGCRLLFTRAPLLRCVPLRGSSRRRLLA